VRPLDDWAGDFREVVRFHGQILSFITYPGAFVRRTPSEQHERSAANRNWLLLQAFIVSIMAHCALLRRTFVAFPVDLGPPPSVVAPPAPGVVLSLSKDLVLHSPLSRCCLLSHVILSPQAKDLVVPALLAPNKSPTHHSPQVLFRAGSRALGLRYPQVTAPASAARMTSAPSLPMNEILPSSG
jgi:hypothetical protein